MHKAKLAVKFGLLIYDEGCTHVLLSRIYKYIFSLSNKL
jgi:hypothetical protein